MSGRWIPNGPEISRETLAVIAGALLAAFFFSQLPSVKKWVADNLPTASPPSN